MLWGKTGDLFRQYLRSVLNFQFCRNKTFLFNVVHRDFPQKMASALSENPASVIHSLNLAHNTLDNQGTNLDSYELFFPPPTVSLRATLIVFLGGVSAPCYYFTAFVCFQRIQNQSLSSQNLLFSFMSVFSHFFLSYISSCMFWLVFHCGEILYFSGLTAHHTIRTS